MTIILRKSQGQFKIEATNTTVTCSCLACGDSQDYLAFNGISVELISYRLDAYRETHSKVCPKLVKSAT